MALEPQGKTKADCGSSWHLTELSALPASSLWQGQPLSPPRALTLTGPTVHTSPSHRLLPTGLRFLGAPAGTKFRASARL